MTADAIGARWAAWGPRLQSLLRIVAAALFIPHGTMKLFAFPASLMPGGGTVALVSQYGLGGILETVGGTLLLLGLWTRPVAFLLAGEMAVVYWQLHFPQGIWPIMTGGEVPALHCVERLLLQWR